MAAAFVKVTKIENGASASASGSVSSTAANALFALVNEYNPGAGTLTVSGGGTWTTDGSTAALNLLKAAFASTPSATGGAQTITTTFSAGGGTTSFILEFSGMATSSILDAMMSAGNSGTTATPTSPALTNVQADAVFLAATVTDSGGTLTWSSTGTGWTLPAGGSEPDGTSQLTAAVGYKIVASAASQTETWGIGGTTPGWCAGIASYKVAAAGGGGGGLPFFMQQDLLSGGMLTLAGGKQ